MNEIMNIGILGGTFDPVHIGHLWLAEIARDKLGLNKVIFIPARKPPHKNRMDIIDVELRYKMVELAILDNSFFSVSRLEVEKTAVSYSIETVRLIKKENPYAVLYFIVGCDVLPELNTWKEINELFKLVNFVVAGRPGFKKYPLPPGAVFLDDIFLAISASKIRNRIRKGESVRYLLTEKVYNFIIKHSLYQ